MSDVPLLVAERLHDRSRERPDRVAIADDRRSVTFAEAAQLSNGLAELLPPGEEPVVVLVDRRVASVIAMLGVLWSGRAAVAIDVDDPRARVLDLVEWTGAGTVVDATGRIGRDPALPRTIAMEDVVPTSGSPRPMATDRLAHLLLTSGSTGRPKGVPRTAGQLDRQFTQWVAWTNFEDPLPATERPDGRAAGGEPRPHQLDGSVAVLVPLLFQGGFTASVFAAAAGRRVELVDSNATEPSAIADRIDDRSIERMTLTPSHIRSIGRGLARHRRLDSVHEVFGVGEASDFAHVETVRAFASTAVIYRARYGASEIVGMFNRGVVIGPEAAVADGLVPLGVMPGPSRARLDPIDGRVDVGELIVRAPVIDGYWRDPELTDRRFGIDPDGVRFWRTGDLLAVDEHGNLHARGRIDDMAKINGRLVEPAESETVLRSIPGVRGAVTLPRELPSGRQQLVGHVEADTSVSAVDLRRAMLTSLPTGIVPSVLVRHDHLPLNARGKVDRVALRSRTITPWTDTEPRPPTTSLERSLLPIIARILDIETLGIDDDVFAIGCDSLAAVELIETLRETCDVTISPNDLVDHPTPALLAGMISTRRTRSVDWVVTRNRDGSRPTLHLLCGGGAPAIQYQPLVDNLGPDQPVALYEQAGLHDRSPRDRSIERSVSRHLPRLTELSPEGPVVLLGHSYGGRVANDLAIALDSMGRDVQLIVLDAHAWSASRGPRPAGRLTRLVLAARRTRLGLRPLDERLDRFRSMDEETRYARFFTLASRDSARHRLEAFAGPTLYIQAATPAEDVRWPIAAGTRVVTAPGDHNTVLQFRETAALIAEVVERTIGP